MPSPIKWSTLEEIQDIKDKQIKQEVLLKYLVCKLEGTEPPKMIKKKGKKIYITYAQKGK